MLGDQHLFWIKEKLRKESHLLITRLVNKSYDERSCELQLPVPPCWQLGGDLILLFKIVNNCFSSAMTPASYMQTPPQEDIISDYLSLVQD